jgi:predicted adenine nucleotide alpha hydrolase (AANH) superfamily ATPase
MKKLLLHICCAPCGSHVADVLKKEYEVSLFYFNPNIFTTEEKDKRLVEAKKLAASYDLPLLEGDYDHDAWREVVKGHELDAEGGERCGICFLHRLANTAKQAKALGFDCFAATLSISPHKDLTMVSQAGQAAAMQYGVEFVDVDWKQDGGYQHSVELSKAFGFYRQNYCGCEFSLHK